MRATSAAAVQSDPVRLPETFGPAPIKVGLRADHVGLGELAFECLVAHFGSVKELAFALGQCDPSLVRRELKDGDFSRFDKHADASARAALAEAISNAWGRMRSPEDAADHAVDAIRKASDLLSQYIAHKRTA